MPAKRMTEEQLVDAVTAKIRRTLDETYLPKVLEKVNDHDKKLYGNGEEGIIVKLSLLEQSVSSGLRDVRGELAELSKSLSGLIQWKNKWTLKTVAMTAAISTISTVFGVLATALTLLNVDGIAKILK